MKFFKIKVVLKKTVVFLLMVALVIGFSGCRSKQTNNIPGNPTAQKQTKLVHIDSDPQGAIVFIDDNFVVRTPSDVELTMGKHSIIFNKDGYENCILNDAEVKKDTAEINIKLKKIVDENIIKLVRNNLSVTLSNTLSKLVFVSNGALYLGDESGKTVEKVAVVDNNYRAQIFGVSPTLQWVILRINSKDIGIDSEQFLYALNIETLELVKIAEDYWEGGFRISFNFGNDELIYGFQGVNAPYAYVADFNLNTKKNTYLLNPENNKLELAYAFDISPDKRYVAYAGGNVEVFPDNRTALYLKNLETDKLKMLVKASDLDRNEGEDFISGVNFINGGKEILYSREIWKQSSTYNPVVKYFVTDFNRQSREISLDDALKLMPSNYQLLEAKLKKILNKNLYVYAVLKKCGKIVFTVWNENKPDKLFLCNFDFSNIQDTGISDLNNRNFSDSCKFVCEASPNPETFGSTNSTWYLVDAKTNTKINLEELSKMNISSAIYIGK